MNDQSPPQPQQRSIVAAYSDSDTDDNNGIDIGPSKFYTVSPIDERQQLIFLEGPACIGKTTSSMISFDFTYYLQKYENFASKLELGHVNSLYEQLLSFDILQFIVNIQIEDCHKRPSSPKFIDRSHFSSIIYNILFYCDGHILQHNEYKQRFEKYILSDYTYCSVFADMCRKSWNLILRLAPNLDIKLLCVIPNDIDSVVLNLRRRNGFEYTMGFDLMSYTQNQIYTFKKLLGLANIGSFMYTDKEYISTEELFNFINPN